MEKKVVISLPCSRGLINYSLSLFTHMHPSCMFVAQSCLTDTLQPHGLYIVRFLSPWDSPGKNTGLNCQFLLQEIFPTQGSNLGLPHCRQISYYLSHQGSPLWLAYRMNFIHFWTHHQHTVPTLRFSAHHEDCGVCSGVLCSPTRLQCS